MKSFVVEIPMCLLFSLLIGCAGYDTSTPYLDPPLKVIASDIHLNKEGRRTYSVTAVFDGATSIVLDAILKDAASLRFVASSFPPKETKWRRDHNSRIRNGLGNLNALTHWPALGVPDRLIRSAKDNNRNYADLAYDRYVMPFAPPPVPWHRISEGWFCLRLRGSIVFEIGTSKTSPHKTFVYMERTWTYWSITSLPRMDIPLPLMENDEGYAVLESDVDWLHRLGSSLGVNVMLFDDTFPFDDKVYRELTDK